MKQIFFLLLVGSVIIGCSNPQPSLKVEPKLEPKEIIPNKAQEIYYNPQTQEFYNNGSCWDGQQTINCEIKRTYDLIKKLNYRIEDSLNGWGGCCE